MNNFIKTKVTNSKLVSKKSTRWFWSLKNA